MCAGHVCRYRESCVSFVHMRTLSIIINENLEWLQWEQTAHCAYVGWMMNVWKEKSTNRIYKLQIWKKSDWDWCGRVMTGHMEKNGTSRASCPALHLMNQVLIRATKAHSSGELKNSYCVLCLALVQGGLIPIPIKEYIVYFRTVTASLFAGLFLIYIRIRLLMIV